MHLIIHTSTCFIASIFKKIIKIFWLKIQIEKTVDKEKREQHKLNEINYEILKLENCERELFYIIVHYYSISFQILVSFMDA